MKRGVFWLIENELLAFPFDGSLNEGIAKSGNTYNHKKLWQVIKPCNCPYNYYPRGRVEISSKGKAIIYMNPNIGEEWIMKIKELFDLQKEPAIRYDYRMHYKCYLDRGWTAD